jgi:crossover junction endodeoxyribonuclease RuvC
VLGVDPGLATTGWGVIEKSGSQPQLKAFGAIVTAAGQALPGRLKQLRRELLSLVATYKPQVLAIEELFFTKFAVSIAATAQARGVILVTAAELDLPLVEYNPRAVKMATTGFGSANKIQMQEMVRRQLQLSEIPKPDDAADALALALCHVQTHHHLKVPTSRRSRAAFEAEMAARAGVRL